MEEINLGFVEAVELGGIVFIHTVTIDALVFDDGTILALVDEQFSTLILL